jgi:glycosyltransferase involved in cell wall biosynthesis
MRVAHVVPSLAVRTGGVATSVVESCIALEEQSVDTTVFTTDLAEAASAKGHRRVTLAELPSGAASLEARIFRSGPPRRLAFSPGLYRALEREIRGYDVVHIHSLFLFPQWAGFHHSLRQGVPYIVSPRGALDPWLRQRARGRKAIIHALWQRRMLEGAALLEVTTEDEAAGIADVAPDVPRTVVPNPIDWEFFQLLPDGSRFRHRHLAGHQGPVLLYVGRLSHVKGLDVLIRAFALVRRQVPDAVLAVVGPDDEELRPRLAALAHREGVGQATTFVGMLTGEDKLAALAAADVWALASHTENFGVAVAEALAAGCATVISPAVKLASDARAAGAAIVCETDPALFAAEIASLLRDPLRRAELGQRAIAFARRYDRSVVGARLVEMYDRARGQAARSPVQSTRGDVS